jgi:hypothetical protein
VLSGISAYGVATHATHFYRASCNIQDQHEVVAAQIRQLTSNRDLILVGDAGAIPYLSERHAIDAIGLGGYGGLPFARAAVLGEGAIAELLQRLPIAERPKYFAMYASWFPFITGQLGEQMQQVSVTDNVICGATTKSIYLANYSLFEDPGPAGGDRATPRATGREALDHSAELDEIDIGDLLSERPHNVLATGSARGAVWGVVVHESTTRAYFDAGRPLVAAATLQWQTSADTVLVRASGDCSALLVDGIKPTQSTPSGDAHYVRYSISAARRVHTLSLDRGAGGCVVLHLWATPPN